MLATMSQHAPSIDFVKSHHRNMTNKSGDGGLDDKSIAFTLGFVAGVEYARAARGAAPVKSLKLAPQSDVLFLDMDDCLYTNNWQVAEVISANIKKYCVDVLGLAPDENYKLYKKYGTTLRGLMREHLHLDVDDYMVKAHDISSVIHLIKPDLVLKDMLERCKVPAWVFTAATMDHAHNCLGSLGVLSFFHDRILACTSRDMGFGSKYEAESFHLARVAAGPRGLGSADGIGAQGELDPSHCYFADDSPKNIERAKKCGWHTCLVGKITRGGESNEGFEFADHVVESVHELEKIWPHLFAKKK